VARGLGFVDEVLWRATDSGNEDRVAASFDFPELTTPEFPDLDTISGLLPPTSSSITVDLGRGAGERSFVADPVSVYETRRVPEPSSVLLTACGLAGLAAGRARRWPGTRRRGAGRRRADAVGPAANLPGPPGVPGCEEGR